MSQEHLDGANSLPAIRRRSGNDRYSLRAPEGLRIGRHNENLLSHTFLLWVLRQWWMIVIPAGVVIASGVAFIIWYMHVPKYEASALMMIEDSGPFVAFSSRATGSHSQRYVQTQLELLRSPVVLEPVLSRTEIASLPELVGKQDRVAYLRERMSIRQIGQSELYNINYRSASPQAAANVVNAVIVEYLNIQKDDEFQRSQRVIDILDEERNRRGLEVERLRKRVVDLAKEVTGRDPFSGAEVTDYGRALSPVSALFQSLTAADVEREVRRAELQSILDAPALALGKAESSGLLDIEIETHEDIRSRLQAIKTTEAQMDAIKQQAVQFKKNPNAEHAPAYVRLKDVLKQQRADLNEAKARIRGDILTKRQAQQTAEHEQQVAKMKLELASLDARRELLSKRFEEQVKNLKSGGGGSVEMEFARAELGREEKVFELIASRKLALQTELRAPARIQLRQKANVPVVPIEPIPFKLLLMASSVALVAPFGLAVLREITVRRISDIDQLAQETRLRILGGVAALPVRYVAVTPRELSGRVRRDTYIFAESINCLRTNLALAAGLSGEKIFAVTSASASEGKTSVAVSLALSIANASENPTLIIDGDMRSPYVGTMLKTNNHPGLFEVLSNKCSMDAAIQQVGKSHLYVIAAGRATRSAHSVVGVAELKLILEQLRQRFSTIIIDTPPILGASESLVLAKAADSVLFCSLCDVSKAKQVRLAIERLENADIHIAGAVLSGMPGKRYEHVYGYYANRIESEN
jgi:capsular exopolysaccharide synthesis family protein